MAVSRTATLRLQLIDAVSGPAKGVAGALKGMDGSLKNIGKGGSAELQALIKRLENLKRVASQMSAFQDAARGSKEMRRAFQEARNEVSKLESALKNSTKPTAKMKSDLAAAKEALRQTASAWREQINATKQAQAALNGYNISSFSRVQQKVRDEIKKTTDAIHKQVEAERKSNEQANKKLPVRPGQQTSGLRDAAVATVGTTATYYGKEAAVAAVTNAIDMSKETDFQRAIAKITPAEQVPLSEQAFKIGLETRFSNADVVKAQTMMFQAGIRDPKVVIGMIDEITQYALAMNTTLEEGAETIRSGMQIMNKDISDPKTAQKNTEKFVDFAVNMAKLGGMNDSDVLQYFKYGGASSSAAGLPDDLVAAIGVTLRKGGLRGEEAGVFARAAASKLVAPTNKGMDALDAMGINYSDYAKTGGINLDGIDIMMKRKFGKSLTDDMKEQLKDLVENGEFTDEAGNTLPIVADRGTFTEGVSDIVRPLFAGKDGKMAAADSKALAKAVGDYHKYSADSVDAVGLLYKIMQSNPTQAQLNALFTTQQSGRARVLQQRFGEFDKTRQELQNVPQGYARDIGRVANEGLYGDATKFKGSIETLLTKVGQDWEGVYRPLMNAAADAMDAFVQLPQPVRMMGEAAVAAGAALLGLAAAASLANFLRGGKVAAAATAAATAATSATPGVVAGTAAGIGWRGLMRLAARGSLPLTAASMVYDGLTSIPTAGMESATKADPELPIKLENARRRQMREQPLGFEGGMHRVGTGFGPASADAATAGSQIKQQLSVEATPTLNTSAVLAAAAAAAARIRAMLSGASSASSASAPAAKTQLGRKAAGGAVHANRSYLVGERGPEVVTMGSNGYVTPNHQVATSHNNTNHFHISANDPKGVAAAISQLLDRQLARSRQTSIDGRPVTA